MFKIIDSSIAVSDLCVNFACGISKSGRSFLKSFTSTHTISLNGLVPSAFTQQSDDSQGYFAVDCVMVFASEL